MKLSRLPDLHRLRGECKNPLLQKYYDEAIRVTLAGASDERFPHIFMRAALWVFLVFFVASGTIGILVALKLIPVDPAGFGLIWKTFVGSVVGLATAMLKKGVLEKAKSQ
jgi:hypothetical protein